MVNSKSGLTPKRERFCLVYVETGIASEAYRQVYSTKNMKPESIWVEASKLLADPMVSQRISELRSTIREKHDLTVEKIINQLLEDRSAALSSNQIAAAVRADELLGKHLGIFTDRIQLAGDPVSNILKALADDES